MLGQKPNYMSCFVLEIGPWATIIIIIIFLIILMKNFLLELGLTMNSFIMYQDINLSFLKNIYIPIY